MEPRGRDRVKADQDLPGTGLGIPFEAPKTDCPRCWAMPKQRGILEQLTSSQLVTLELT